MERYSNNDSGAKNLFLGIALGVGLGILFAPENGEVIRQNIKHRAQRAINDVEKAVEDNVGNVKEKAEDIRSKIEDKVSDVRSDVESKVDEAQNEAEKAVNRTRKR